MNKVRNQDGFTLLELLIAIVCATLITIAASTTLLLGLRMNAGSAETINQQGATRIVLSLMEKLASEGQIATVDNSSEEGWILYREDGQVILNYSDAEDAILIGGAVLMENVTASSIAAENRLLTVTITTGDNTYDLSVYCRTLQPSEIPGEGFSAEDLLLDLQDTLAADDLARKVGTDSKRYALLSLLIEEIGSTGKISGTNQYYSQWYIHQRSNWNWPTDTPWCACFLSWAAAQESAQLPEGSIPYFADVKDGVSGFKGLPTGNGVSWNGGWEDSGYTPAPGDFIFFNLDADCDPDHVGAVLYVENGIVYTIEGNCDGKVAVRSYELEDFRIVGYGLLNWEE